MHTPTLVAPPADVQALMAVIPERPATTHANPYAEDRVGRRGAAANAEAG